MPADVCAVVLSAGEGTRLRPLTATLPKALCPVGNVPLLDHALTRLARHGLTGPDVVAVNACYLADRVVGHVGDRAFVSCEPGPPALGTSGALYHLRDWIAGRGVLAVNADAYLAPADPRSLDLAPLLDGWDGRTVRVLAVAAGDRPAEFIGPDGAGYRFAGASLLPADLVAVLPPGRSDLVLTVWRPAERAGRLEITPYGGRYTDCGTPTDYLTANLHAAALAGGSLIAPDATVTGTVVSSVVGSGAVVAGSITRCVVLPGARVAPDETLVDAVRLGNGMTCAC
ncbi:MAG: NTP transferase domain-containing protein [Micromonosporaceae bacterium]|nr:NTP transferase domain-containing protein [Micromonosporaceae bacterium]